jgi:hypothetical protein
MRACARDLRSRMDPESVSGGAIPKNPAKPIRARNWQVHRKGKRVEVQCCNVAGP